MKSDVGHRECNYPLCFRETPIDRFSRPPPLGKLSKTWGIQIIFRPCAWMEPVRLYARATDKHKGATITAHHLRHC